MSLDNTDNDTAKAEVETHGNTGAAWAGTVSFIAVLLFIGTLIYLAHNHWHF
jgi:hypothetical protein